MAGGKKTPKKPATNGTSTPALVAAEPKGPPVVIGISLGDSYASIAVVNKEGQPECIANENGERQIACAVSFLGQEVYIGNQARPQLVKNAKNTITNFRNLLGKKFSSLSQPSTTTSAPVIAGPDDIPAYTVIYIPAPPDANLAQMAPASGTATPKTVPGKKSVVSSVKATPLATPRPSSPQPTEKTLTASEAATMVLESLHGSAYDFLGKEIEGAVISCPSWFEPEQKAALKAAAQDAGIKVIGFIDEPTAAVLAYDEREKQTEKLDRTTLVVDLGASSLTVTALSVKDGLIHPLASVFDASVGGNEVDNLLIGHFAKEFTKQTKVQLKFPATTPEDARAEAKLRLEVEHTKRTLSAGRNTAPCNVESLKEGLDLHSNITRMRFDLLIGSVYKTVEEKVKECLQKAGLDVVHVEEVLLVGASSMLPGLKDALSRTFGIVDDEDEDDEEAAKSPTKPDTVIRNILEPYSVVALGAVLHARQLASLSDSDKPSLAEGSGLAKVRSTAKAIGLVFHQADGSKPFVPVIAAHTPLPLRRVVRFEVDAAEVPKVAFEVWEGELAVEVRHNGELVDEAAEAAKPKKEAADDDEDDEDEVDITRKRTIRPTQSLGGLSLDLEGGAKSKVLVRIEVSTEGAVEVKLSQEGMENVKVLNVPAP